MAVVDTAAHGSTYGAWSFATDSAPTLRGAGSACATSNVDWDIHIVGQWTPPANGTACPRTGATGANATVVVDSQAELERLWQ